NEHGQVGVRDLADDVEHPLHGRALPDQALEAMAFGDLLAEQLQVAPQRDAFQHPLDNQLELVVVERLRQVVRRAGLHCLDGDHLRAVGGDHDHRTVRAPLLRTPQHVHPGNALQVQIGDDELVGAVVELLDRLLAGDRRLHLVATRRQQPLDRDPDGTLVVNDQDRRAHEPPASGNSTSTRSPWPEIPVAVINPPWASTVRLAMARPSPVPVGLSEKKGSKSRGRASAGTPGPVAPAWSRAMPFFPLTTTTRCRGSSASRSASRAFSTRFRITCCIFSPSARATIPSGASSSVWMCAASRRGRSGPSTARASAPRSTGPKRNSSRRENRSSAATCCSTRSSSSTMTSAASPSPDVDPLASCCARLRAAVTGLRMSCAMRAAVSPQEASL